MPLESLNEATRDLATVPDLMTPAQCRAARGLLRWTQDMLAEMSKVSVNTIHSFENEMTKPHGPKHAALQCALEKGGIIFTPEDDNGGPGVRLARGKGHRVAKRRTLGFRDSFLKSSPIKGRS